MPPVNEIQAFIGGLHCRHVGGQKKRKFAHIVCIKMEVNSQRRNILLFLSTNSHHDVTCKPSIEQNFKMSTCRKSENEANI